MSGPLLKHFIDGAFVEGSARNTFPNVSPIHGGVLQQVCEGGRDDIDRAVAAARRALRGPWGTLSVPARCDMLHAISSRIMERFDEFVAAEIADTGRPLHHARTIDVPRGAANFKIFADVVRNVPTETFQTPTPDGRGALNYVLRKPKGVIGVICPWNLPLLLMTWKVGPALACGNTVIVKPSEETPSTTILLAEVMEEVGVPKGVFNVVHGFGPDSAGAYLTQHPDVDAITFTGETRTGTAIMQAAAHGVRDVSFELGGKNPALVFADCDLDAAIEATTRSVFGNCGQVCLGTERIYVERVIFDSFVERLASSARALRPGDPYAAETTLGPLISQGHREKVLSYYQKAKEQGAQVVTGGGVPQMPASLAGGSWIEPTLFTGLSEESPVVQEEIFGPCAHIRPFDDEEEAISLANATDYGLAATIWTRDLTRAHRVAPQIESGITWVNSWFLRDLRTPFGGAKKSGIGREGGIHSLEFYTESQNICVKL